MIKLDDLEVYKTAMELGDLVYNAVLNWRPLDKETLGRQLIRSADSIGLNIAEGYGRFFYKENKVFCYYSRGSAFETIAGLRKAWNRKLLSEAQYADFKSKFERFLKLLNAYIKSIGVSKDTDQ